MGRIFIPVINHVVNNQTSIKRWLPARIIQLLLGYHTYLRQFQQILSKYIKQIHPTIHNHPRKTQLGALYIAPLMVFSFLPVIKSLSSYLYSV